MLDRLPERNLNFTNLVEKKVIDVVSEKGSQLALLSLTWPHVHLYLLDESEQNSQKKKKSRKHYQPATVHLWWPQTNKAEQHRFMICNFSRGQTLTWRIKISCWFPRHRKWERKKKKKSWFTASKFVCAGLQISPQRCGTVRQGQALIYGMVKMCAHTPFVRKSLVTGLDSNTPQGKPHDTKCFLKHSAQINAQINQSPLKRILWPSGPAKLYLPVTSRNAGDTESKDKCFMWETGHKSAVKWSYKYQSWWWFGCRKNQKEGSIFHWPEMMLKEERVAVPLQVDYRISWS